MSFLGTFLVCIVSDSTLGVVTKPLSTNMIIGIIKEYVNTFLDLLPLVTDGYANNENAEMKKMLSN